MRVSISQLRESILTGLPDNVSGLITPEIVRNVLTNMTDSLSPTFSTLFGNHPTPIPQLLTDQWSVLQGVDLYPNAGSGDITELPFNQANGSFSVVFGNYFHTGVGNIVMTGISNRAVEMALGNNGVPLGVTVEDAFSGTRPMTISLDVGGIAPPNAVLQLMLRKADGGANFTVNIRHIGFRGALWPTVTP